MFANKTTLLSILLTLVFASMMLTGCGDETPMSPMPIGQESPAVDEDTVVNDDDQAGDDDAVEDDDQIEDDNDDEIGDEDPIGDDDQVGDDDDEIEDDTEDDGENDGPQIDVLLSQQINGPIAVAGTAFTNVGSFLTRNDGPITIVVVSSLGEISNILVNVARPNGGASVNQAQFIAGTANPATLEITRPQRGQGYAIRIADERFSPTAVYKVTVTQVVD